MPSVKFENPHAFAPMAEPLKWEQDKAPHRTGTFCAVVLHGSPDSQNAGHPLGSIVAAALVPAMAWLFGYSYEYIIFGLLAALLIVVRHHANIGRLLSGTESKIHAGHR